MKNHNKTQFLKQLTLLLAGLFSAGVLYAQLDIPTNIDNAKQTIQTIVVTDNGRADGNKVMILNSGGTAAALQVSGSVVVGKTIGSDETLLNRIIGNFSSILAGFKNKIFGSYSAILGGDTNTLTGNDSAIIGGQNNKVNGNYSVAGGINAQANHNYTWVWSDDDVSYSTPFASTNSNQFLIRALNGVGINTNTPGGALDVNGLFKAGGNYYNVLSYNFNGTPVNGVKIKTNIPYTNGSQMPLITIDGYDYGAGSTFGVSFVWYVYNGNFTNYMASSYGNTTPVLKLANEGGYVTIHLAWTPYYGRFNVHAYAQGMGEPASWFQGWTVVDQVPGATNQVTVPYSNTFPGTVNFAGGGIWNNNGSVGIGTNSPNYKLDVRGPTAINGGALYVRSNPAVAWDFVKLSTDGAVSRLDVKQTDFRIGLNNTADAGETFTDAVAVNQDGNVGINTITPATKLDVVGSATFGNNASSRGAYSNGLSVQNNGGVPTSLFLWEAGVGSAHLGFKANDSNLYLVNSYSDGLIANAAYLALTNAGNVGIGVSNPSNKLEVAGSNPTTFDGAGVYNTYAYGDANKAEARLNLGKIEGGTTRQAMGAVGAFPTNNGDSSNGNMVFYTRNTQNLVERARIDKDGNVGIGTTTPSTKAHIYGTLTVDPSGISNNYSEGIRIGAATNGYSVVTFGANPATANGSQANQWWLGKDGRDNGFNLYGASYGDALHVGTNGNVGIGTISPSGKLDVYGPVGNPSLSVNSPATANFRVGGHVQMAISTQLASPYTTSLQAKHTTADGNAYPIALNPVGGNVGIGTTTPHVKTEILSSPSSYPTLGTAKGNLLLSDNGLWGTFFGLDGTSGNGWIQQMRDDAAVAYNLLLQPVGGNVGIGTTTPTQKLEVAGTAKLSGLSGKLLLGDNGSLGYDTKGSYGQANGINVGGGDGLYLQTDRGGEGAGIFMNGDTIKMWSPGDTNLLDIYDEDEMNGSLPAPKFSVDGNGNIKTPGFWMNSGEGVTANGNSSTAMGSRTTADYDYSTAMGAGTAAETNYTTTMGQCNVGLGNSLLEIGMGSFNGAGCNSRANALTVLNNGNMGIGTTNPTQKLWVDNGDIWIGGNGRKIGFSTDGSTDPTPNASIIASQNGINGASADISFNTWNGSADTEIMRVRSNGNVGIGTNNPQKTLDVAGTIRASTSIETPMLIVDKLVNRTVTNIQVNGQLLPDTTAPTTSQTIGNTSTPWKELYAGGVNAVANGNVGIGVSPLNKLDINGATRFRGDAGMDAGNSMYFGKEESFGGADVGGADYGFIRWDNDNNAYNYWGDSTENGALVIGSMNDGNSSVSDVVVLKPSASTIVDSPMRVNGATTIMGDTAINGNLSASNVSSSIVGNNIVKRDVNGYIYGNYFNTTADVRGDNPTYIMGTFNGDDGWMRKVAPSNVTVGAANNLTNNRSTWNNYSTISNVVGQLSWKNYGNGHTIFDASNATSPDGTSIDRSNSQVAWTAAYPTLMGWNGSNTYGVRVDSARRADSASSADTATNISNGGTVTLGSATESNAITITQPGYGTNSPVKLLNFNWYSDSWSLGNIRSGGTPTNGFGIYLNGTQKVKIDNNGTIYSAANGQPYFCGGDDACLNDVNVSNTVGIYGLQDSSKGGLRLGSAGADIYGAGGNIGIGNAGPGYKLDVNGSINTNSNLCLNGNCKSAWLDTNGNSFNGLNVGDLGAVYGNSFEKNLFAFNAPSSYEVFNGSSWNGQSVPTSLFSDNAAHNWGGGLAVSSGTPSVRFTWNSFGYRFRDALSLTHSTNGNSFTATLQGSNDGSNWTTFFTTPGYSSWPGYSVFKNAGNNSPASQYMRLIINFSWNNGNSINFGDIALMGSYGGYTSLYDWDYSRNITLKNNLTVPSQVKASQYCDINGANCFSAVNVAAPFASLSPDYIPRWNGSSLINSAINDNGTSININRATQIADDGMGYDTASYATFGVTRSNNMSLNLSYFGLTKAGTVPWGIGIGGGSNAFIIGQATAGTKTIDNPSLTIGTNGNVAIGAISNASKLNVAGSLQLANGTSINEFSTDMGLMDNSDTAVPTERAVRSAIQSQICPPAFAHIEDTSAGEDEFASYDECYPATYVPSGTPASYGSAGTVLRALHAWDGGGKLNFRANDVQGNDSFAGRWTATASEVCKMFGFSDGIVYTHGASNGSSLRYVSSSSDYIFQTNGAGWVMQDVMCFRSYSSSYSGPYVKTNTW